MWNTSKDADVVNMVIESRQKLTRSRCGPIVIMDLSDDFLDQIIKSGHCGQLEANG